MASKTVFVEGNLIRHLLALTATSAASLIAIFAVDLITLLYISSLGRPSLTGALGLAASLNFFMSCCSMGPAGAAMTLVSRYLGQGRKYRALRLSASALVLQICLMGIVVVVAMLLLPLLISLLGGAHEVQIAAQSYLSFTLPAAIMMSVGQLAAHVLRATGHGRAAMNVTLSGVAVAAATEPIFILWLHLGVTGAGIAYALARTATALLGLWYLIKAFKLMMPIRRTWIWVDIKRMGRLCGAILSGSLATPIGLAFLMGAIARTGADNLAAMTVIDRITQICFAAYFMLPVALGPILGQNFGAGDRQRVGASVRVSVTMVLVYGLAIALVLQMIASWLPAVFSVGKAGANLFDAFCVYGPILWALIGLQFVAIPVFNTLGRPFLTTLFNWLRATAGSIPFIWFGQNHYGATGAMLGQLVGNAIVAIFAFLAAVWCLSTYLRTSVLHGAPQVG